MTNAVNRAQVANGIEFGIKQKVLDFDKLSHKLHLWLWVFVCWSPAGSPELKDSNMSWRGTSCFPRALKRLIQCVQCVCVRVRGLYSAAEELLSQMCLREPGLNWCVWFRAVFAQGEALHPSFLYTSFFILAGFSDSHKPQFLSFSLPTCHLSLLSQYYQVIPLCSSLDVIA